MKRFLLLMGLAVSGCASPNPHSPEDYVAACQVRVRTDVQQSNKFRRLRGEEPLKEDDPRRMANCQRYLADMANMMHRASPEYQAQQARGALVAGIVLGAASDALWVNNMRRAPLETIAPYRRR